MLWNCFWQPLDSSLDGRSLSTISIMNRTHIAMAKNDVCNPSIEK